MDSEGTLFRDDMSVGVFCCFNDVSQFVGEIDRYCTEAASNLVIVLNPSEGGGAYVMALPPPWPPAELHATKAPALAPLAPRTPLVPQLAGTLLVLRGQCDLAGL